MRAWKIMSLPRILLLDDDRELAELLTEYLTGDGFEVTATVDPARGLEAATAGKCDILLLDVMLGTANGFDVLRQLRAKSDVPVLMLTARGEELDRIVGLELGADDYLAKPFHARELAARIRAILRRAAAPDTSARPPAPIVLQDLRLDLGARRAFKDNEPVQLTAVEFGLLEILVRSAGQLVTRDDLFKRVLGRRIIPFDRSIDMHVSNLRRKLGHRIGDVERIQSVRGVGYIYALPADPTPRERA
ncbi:MAG: response regulator [Phycisphaerae bacterium]